MLDIVRSFPLLSYCIVSPIYISPICNVEIDYSVEIIKIGNSLFFSLHSIYIHNESMKNIRNSLQLFLHCFLHGIRA